MSRSRFDPERDEPQPGNAPDAPPAPVQALRPGTSNWALARWLDSKQLDRYVGMFKSKGLAHLDAETAASVIRKQLEADRRPAFDLAVEMSQILPGVGHAVAPEEAAQARIDFAETGPLDGYARAIQLERAEGAGADVQGLIDGLDAGNMFSQHDADLARYDPQNPTKTAANYQIQIGGKKLKTKGKSSVTAVLFSDELTRAFNAGAATADFKAAVVARMRQAHTHSHATGQVVRLELRKQ